MKNQRVIALNGFDKIKSPIAVATYYENKFSLDKLTELSSDSGMIVHTRLGKMPKVEAQMLNFMDEALKRLWNYEPKKVE